MIRRGLATLLATLALLTSPAAAQEAPDLILHDARILTMVAPAEAGAVAVRDGAILAVGGEVEIVALAGPETQTVALGGATVMPGLIDNHTHAMRAAGGDPSAFARTAAALNAAGVSTIVDAGGFNFDPRMRRAATDLEEQGELTLRVLFLEWLPGASVADARRNAARLPEMDIGGAGLARVIGVGETLMRPLHDRPNRPVAMTGDARDAAAELVRALDANDLPLHLHAFRDDTIIAFLDLFEAEAPGAAARLGWAFHHANGLTAPTMRRLADLGFAVAVHPRGAAIAPSLANLEAAGITWGLGTDGGMSGPMLDLVDWASRDRPGSVSRATALRAVTVGNADLLGRPDLGRIAPGARADLVVLGGDPRDPSIAAGDLPVLLTMVDGRIVHDAR